MSSHHNSFKIHSNMILSAMPSSSKWLLSFWFPHQNSATRWLHYTDILWWMVSKTLRVNLYNNETKVWVHKCTHTHTHTHLVWHSNLEHNLKFCTSSYFSVGRTVQSHAKNNKMAQDLMMTNDTPY
jgi:hypothetical protein